MSPCQFSGHFGQHVAIQLHACLLHAVQHKRQRQIDLAIEPRQSGSASTSARKRRGQPQRDVGGLGQRPGELQSQPPQRNLGQRVRAVGRVQQIRVQHGVVLHPGQRHSRSSPSACSGTSHRAPPSPRAVGQQLRDARAVCAGQLRREALRLRHAKAICCRSASEPRFCRKWLQAAATLPAQRQRALLRVVFFFGWPPASLPHFGRAISARSAGPPRSRQWPAAAPSPTFPAPHPSARYTASRPPLRLRREIPSAGW